MNKKKILTPDEFLKFRENLENDNCFELLLSIPEKDSPHILVKIWANGNVDITEYEGILKADKIVINRFRSILEALTGEYIKLYDKCYGTRFIEKGV